MSWDFLSQIWSRAVRWAGKNGLSIDPNGSPDPSSMNGPSVDPHGGFPIDTKNGLSIDPDGHTSTMAQNPQDGSCLPGSGGCGT
jgi:hypothetical protein